MCNPALLTDFASFASSEEKQEKWVDGCETMVVEALQAYGITDSGEGIAEGEDGGEQFSPLRASLLELVC
jgi:hypothetical protein